MCYSQRKGRKFYKGGTCDKIPQLILRSHIEGEQCIKQSLPISPLPSQKHTTIDDSAS